MSAGGLGARAEKPGGGQGGEGYGDLGSARGVEGGHVRCDAGLPAAFPMRCPPAERVHSVCGSV